MDVGPLVIPHAQAANLIEPGSFDSMTLVFNVFICTVARIANAVLFRNRRRPHYEEKQRRQDDGGQKARRETQGWEGSGGQAQKRENDHEDLTIVDELVIQSDGGRQRDSAKAPSGSD